MTTILHLIPTLEGGGAERQLSMLATEQARRGWSVHVGLRRAGVHEEKLRNGEVIIHPLVDLKGLHPLLIARVASIVRRIRPHVIHTWLPQMDIVGGLVALASARPWVLSERTSGSAYADAPVLAWMRCLLARYAKAIVANSVEGVEYWARILSTVEHVSNIKNAVDVAAIRGAEPMACEDLGDRRHTLLFVGRLASEKAPNILVQAVSHLGERQDVRALVIGDGPLRDELCASIRTWDRQKRMRILPYQANWWGFLKTAIALVSTSRFEGHPNVVLEAMAAGCPLIVSDIPAHRAILDERTALFVPTDNPPALAGAILSLLSNLGEARQRAKLAYERVAGLTIQQAADAYERVYERILDERSD